MYRLKMLDSIKSLTPCSIAVMSAVALPVQADETNWQSSMVALETEFGTECVIQQQSGAVNIDTNNTLAGINDRIEQILSAAGVTVVRINNGERYYLTSEVARVGEDVDLVVNGFVAQRFPMCSKSNEFMTN